MESWLHHEVFWEPQTLLDCTIGELLDLTSPEGPLELKLLWRELQALVDTSSTQCSVPVRSKAVIIKELFSSHSLLC